MITLEQYKLLLDDDVRRAIDENIERNHLEVALDRRIPHPQIVATQVKYLSKARTKLPTYYASRAIIPDIAFEQSSSEVCAEHKNMEGEVVLDLTCGLGVDALYLSKRFKRVVAIERNEILALVAKENFRRMGVANIEVVNTSAEEFLATNTQRFDWVYIDPDRRSDKGQKLVCLEDCSPNIIDIMPQIERTGDKLALKTSPLFDVDEAFRIFGNCGVEVISLNRECKEVVIYKDGSTPTITAVALSKGVVSAKRSEVRDEFCGDSFVPTKYKYLIVPDVALKKSRLVAHHLADRVDIFSNNGYGFSEKMPTDIIGEVFEVESITQYSPKALKRELKGKGVDIMKHDFPHPTSMIVKQLGVKEGGKIRIAFTKIDDVFWTIRLKNY